MRLNIQIQLEKDTLPKDYRSAFMSLIKAGFEKGDEMYFQQLYNQKTNKPFTFSVYFPELKGAENGHLKVGNKCILNFSSNDPVSITYLYNGIRKLKTHEWKNINTLKVESLKAFFNRDINKDQCLFKTVSPFLINNKGNNLSYLTPDDEAFEAGLRHNVNEICKTFLNKEEVDFEYKILKHKKMVVSHYNQSMTCNKGVIEMKAAPEVLNLLNNVGIGVRRSQGFGMVDII